MAFQLVAVFNLSGRFALRETIAFSCDRPGFLWMNSCNYTSAAKKK